MKKRKRRTDKRGQKLFCIVCLSFLCGCFGGALLANLTEAAQREELVAFLETTAVAEAGYWDIFRKYMKYSLCIWIGGWMPAGVFLSAGVFLFRSMAVGFTASMLLLTFGAKGILTAVTSLLPQNLLLIPMYSLLMTAALDYLPYGQEEGKRALKREKRRRQTEYCILFFASVPFLLLAAGVEKLLL